MKTGLLLGVVAGLFGVTGYLVYTNREAFFGGDKRPRVKAPAVRPVDLNSRPRRSRNNILVRELMRQALFLTEREDVGLPTRDATLGESPADAPQGVRGLIAHAFLREWEGVQVQLFRDPGMAADGEPMPAIHPVPATAERPILFQTLIPNVNREQVDYLGLVERAESFSRGEFRKHLGGTSAKPPAASAPAGSAGEIEERLREMNFISQFAAVRAAHRAARESAASGESMGALVRGYANLGHLTSFHWTAAAKAFHARSLLYAQRMVAGAAAGSPALAEALRYRAYALALAGLQASALNDLDRADKLAPPADGAAQPGWAEVLRPYCRYQPGPLAEVAAAHPADASLATFLCFLTVESVKSKSVTNGYGEVVLATSPDCVRVIDAMSAVSGVSGNHVLTEAAPAIFAQSLARRLPAVGDLPAGVRGALDAAVKADFAPSAAAAIPAALIAAGRDDTAEPSWTVLGRLIEETNFVHVQRRAEFMAEAWDVDPSEFVRETRPLYQGHPYAGVIECYARGGGGAPGKPLGDKLGAALRELERRQPTFSVAPMLSKLKAAGVPVPDHELDFWTWQGRYADFTSTDVERSLAERDYGAFDPRTVTDVLGRTCPDSPTYIVRLIGQVWNHWDAAERSVETWTRDHGDHPMVAAALARKYTDMKDWARAEKFLRLYIEKAPDQWGYQMLADNYLAQGDEANWLATLKARLEKPDYALDHAWTNDLIARHYMGQQKWTVARPYAEAAAQSYARWALETVAECYDGLGERERASAVRAAIAERYGR